MKNSHHHDNFRSVGHQLKRARSESPPPTGRAALIAGAFDDAQPQAKTPHLPGSGESPGLLIDLHGLELDQASERNRNFLNPIQSFWPTPSE